MNLAVLIPTIGALSFGLYPATAQLAYEDGCSPAFLIIVTNFFRALSLIAYTKIIGQPLKVRGTRWPPYLAAGFFQACSIFGILTSLLFLPGPVTIILVFTHTIMLLLFLVFKGEAALDWMTIFTTLAALAGIGLVVDLVNNTSSIHVGGVLLALMAALATVIRLYIYGKEVHIEHTGVVGAKMSSITFLFSLPLLFILATTPPETMYGAIYIALCCISLSVGNFCMFFGIAHAGPFQYSLIVKLEPVFTALFAWLVLDEILSPTQYLGILIVLVSLILYQTRAARTS